MAENPPRRAASTVTLTVVLAGGLYAAQTARNSPNGQPGHGSVPRESGVAVATDGRAPDEPRRLRTEPNEMLTKIQAAGAAVVAATMVSAAQAQQAVQWRTQDGGNGHWYALDGVNPIGRNWADAESSAVARGAHLASITSAAENSFLVSLASAAASGYGTFWIGGYRADSSCTPPCFTWTTGEPWNFESWGPGGEPFDSWGCWGPNPNNCGWLGPGTGLAVELITWGPYAGLWNDETPNLINTGASGAPFIIEWSTDCNNDGLVDYGQIREGHLEDANSNNVPDRCECVAFPALPSCCLGDLNSDRTVDGADLGEFLFAWGPAVPQHPADLDGDGQVDGEDLGLLLANWGPCS